MIPILPVSFVHLILSWFTAITEVEKLGFTDIDHLLPLKDKDRPRGVITFDKGVQSYEDFADDEVKKFHQHGSVSSLMSVIGRTGVAAQNFNLAAESDPKLVNPYSTAPEGSASSAGMTPENFGQTVKPLQVTDARLDSLLRTASKAFPTQDLTVSGNDVIATSTVNAMSPFGL